MLFLLYDKITVRQHFLQSGSIAPTPTKRRKTKRTDAGIEEVRSLVTENLVASLRKIVPHSSSSLTTMWKILRYDLKFKFYRITSVQPLKDTHKQMMSSQEGLISSDKRTVLISTRLTYTFGLLPKK